jgi:hypothetical protein
LSLNGFFSDAGVKKGVNFLIDSLSKLI